MNLPTSLATHSLPLWFLVLSLFLPRICMVLAWLQHNMGQYIPVHPTILAIVAWALVPRILILFWIYADQGLSLWFIIHAVALLLAWGGGGTRVVRRRRVEYVD